VKNFEATKRASTRSQQILSEKIRGDGGSKMRIEINGEARMSNNEEKLNDEIRREAKHILLSI
jgi:hypothetical protein